MFFNKPIIVLTTINKKDANNFINNLIVKKIAACVNKIDQVNSVYKWEGKVVNEFETLLIIKTLSKNIKQLKIFFEDFHPYDIPEFIILKTQTTDKYLNWMEGVISR
jgi:periplasmic divalent cation tolerance protein